MSLVAFFFAALMLAITPGPGIAYVVARTTAGGRSEGLASCLGTAVGGLVHVLAVLGADRLLHSSATRTTRTRVLNYACGGTLVALGIFLATTRRDA